MLKVKVSEGKRRLRWVVPVVVFIVTYICLYVGEGYVGDDEAFVEFPLLSGLAGVGVFFLVTSIYWVMEGFSKDRR